MVVADVQEPPSAEPNCSGSSRIIHTSSLKSDVLCVRFAPDRDYIAAAESSGVVQLIPLRRNVGLRQFELSAEDETLPCTDMAFVPRQSEKKRLLVAYASGFVRLWQITPANSKAVLYRSWREVQYNPELPDGYVISPIEDMQLSNVKFNQLIAIASSYDGKRFVTGGSDTVVRSYEIHSSSFGRMLIPRNQFQNCHTNRVTALIYHPRGMRDASFAHTVISGSWDGTIQAWDDRSCGSLWQHAGTNVAGPDGISIDPVRNLLITGSYRHDKVLAQVWEARAAVAPEKARNLTSMGKPLSEINQEAGLPPTQIYVARIASDSQFMIFGGTNANILKIVNAGTLRTFAAVTNLGSGVYSADSCSDPDDKKRFLVVFSNGFKVHVLLVDPRQSLAIEGVNVLPA
ncbi:unnamed protein product [Calicophoron daubneyi]|uniref:Uncharacterized protein n=1 Tax=Calicophoron daubneyi TaxID=300641 RepID=A0AAV2T5D1_CALDB